MPHSPHDSSSSFLLIDMYNSTRHKIFQLTTAYSSKIILISNIYNTIEYYYRCKLAYQVSEGGHLINEYSRKIEAEEH